MRSVIDFHSSNMTDLKSFRLWLNAERQNNSTMPSIKRVVDPSHLSTSSSLSSLSSPSSSSSCTNHQIDRLTRLLECTETMDSTSNDWSDAADRARIHERDEIIQQLQHETLEQHRRIQEQQSCTTTTQRRRPSSTISARSIVRNRESPNARHLAIYTYTLNDSQYYRIVRGCDATFDVYNRVIAKPTLLRSRAAWLKYSPVCIFKYICENSVDLWLGFKSYYAEFVYGLNFTSNTTFTFHNEESLRECFERDKSLVLQYRMSMKKLTHPLVNFNALGFIDADDCVSRCLTVEHQRVALQAKMIDFIERPIRRESVVSR